MIKKTILSLGTILLLSACTTSQPEVSTSLSSYSFAGGTLYATPEVSNLVASVKALQHTNNMKLNVNSIQNVKVGKALNISAKPELKGYLKIAVINPEGKEAFLLPNALHRGYVKANGYFSTNNSKFKLKAEDPKGLHYVIVAFSEKDSKLSVGTHLLKGLEEIESDKYGKHFISVFPLRVF